MPTEPEHHMDKTLKAYADQRRAEAGAPAELHPATRRLLQGEVARLNKPAATVPTPWWHRRNSFWPRMAAASVIVIASFLTFRGAREEDSVEKLVRREAPASTTAAPADDTLLAKQVQLQDGLDRKSPEPARRLLAPAVPAPTTAPPPANEPVMLAEQKEKSGEARVDLRRNKELMDAVGTTLADRPAPAPLPPQKPAATELSGVTQAAAALASAPAKSESEALAAGNAGQALNWFTKRDAASATSKDKALVVTTASVLDNFAVEQVGDRLNLIDADGSTYTGALEAFTFAESNAVLEAGKKIQQGRDVQLGFATSAPAEAKQSTGNAYRFRASGTNRTLRQPVMVDGVLEGTLVAVSNLGVNIGTAYQNTRGARQQEAAKQNDARYFYRVAGPQQNAPAQNTLNRASQVNLGANVGQADAYQQQNWINANRIQGRVQVGGTNSPVQLFDAVPQTK